MHKKLCTFALLFDTLVDKRPVLQTYEEPAEYHPVESREEDVVQSSVDPSQGTRDDRGRLMFDDAPDFRPTMTPKEVIQAGSFGG